MEEFNLRNTLANESHTGWANAEIAREENAKYGIGRQQLACEPRPRDNHFEFTWHQRLPASSMPGIWPHGVQRKNCDMNFWLWFAAMIPVLFSFFVSVPMQPAIETPVALAPKFLLENDCYCFSLWIIYTKWIWAKYACTAVQPEEAIMHCCQWATTWGLLSFNLPFETCVRIGSAIRFATLKPNEWNTKLPLRTLPTLSLCGNISPEFVFKSSAHILADRQPCVCVCVVSALCNSKWFLKSEKWCISNMGERDGGALPRRQCDDCCISALHSGDWCG